MATIATIRKLLKQALIRKSKYVKRARLIEADFKSYAYYENAVRFRNHQIMMLDMQISMYKQFILEISEENKNSSQK